MKRLSLTSLSSVNIFVLDALEVLPQRELAPAVAFQRNVIKLKKSGVQKKSEFRICGLMTLPCAWGIPDFCAWRRASSGLVFCRRRCLTLKIRPPSSRRGKSRRKMRRHLLKQRSGQPPEETRKSLRCALTPAGSGYGLRATRAPGR